MAEGGREKNTAAEEEGEAREEAKDDGEIDDNNSDGCDDEDDRHMFKERKTPMTPELCTSLLKWFLEWGNLEGIMCACFTAMTWHLACRSNNTARVKCSHMSWQYFDAMHVHFRHKKTQQDGEAARHRRACYSNPHKWEMDLPTLLGLYLATAFNSPQTAGIRLFPGGGASRSARIGDLMNGCLEEHEEEVLAMGHHSTDEIGLHFM